MSETTATVPVRAGYGTGCYRRRIVLEADASARLGANGRGGRVRGELADDFHHFGVDLTHDGDVAVVVAGEDVRVPWTTCPGAVAPLRRMEGAPLSMALPALLRYTDSRAQCTHLHDLACLAIAHAARLGAGGRPGRRYDASIPDRVDGVATVELARDGETLLRWQVDASSVIESTPGTFAGLRLAGASFYRFCSEQLDAELAEAAWVLQRAVFIGLGRRHDFERIHAASSFAPIVGAACHTFDPERVADAKRVYGSLRDFSESPQRILDRD